MKWNKVAEVGSTGAESTMREQEWKELKFLAAEHLILFPVWYS